MIKISRAFFVFPVLISLSAFAQDDREITLENLPASEFAEPPVPPMPEEKSGNDSGQQEGTVPATTPIVVPPSTAPEAPASKDPKGPGTYFAVGLEYSAADRAIAPDVIVVVGNASGTVRSEVDLNTSATLSFEGGLHRPEDIGFNVGFAYDLERTLGSSTLSGPGGTIVGTASKEKITIYNTYTNLTYDTEKAVLFAGLNYSYLDYTPTLSNGQDYEIRSALGYQFGLGFKLKEKLRFQLAWRRVVAKMKLTEGDDSINYQSVHVDGFQTGLKLIF